MPDEHDFLPGGNKCILDGWYDIFIDGLQWANGARTEGFKCGNTRFK